MDSVFVASCRVCWCFQWGEGSDPPLEPLQDDSASVCDLSALDSEKQLLDDCCWRGKPFPEGRVSINIGP